MYANQCWWYKTWSRAVFGNTMLMLVLQDSIGCLARTQHEPGIDVCWAPSGFARLHKDPEVLNRKISACSLGHWRCYHICFDHWAFDCEKCVVCNFRFNISAHVVYHTLHIITILWCCFWFFVSRLLCWAPRGCYSAPSTDRYSALQQRREHRLLPGNHGKSSMGDVHPTG